MILASPNTWSMLKATNYTLHDKDINEFTIAGCKCYNDLAYNSNKQEKCKFESHKVE